MSYSFLRNSKNRVVNYFSTLSDSQELDIQKYITDKMSSSKFQSVYGYQIAAYCNDYKTKNPKFYQNLVHTLGETSLNRIKQMSYSLIKDIIKEHVRNAINSGSNYQQLIQQIDCLYLLLKSTNEAYDKKSQSYPASAP